jgi:hypothetical protein
MVKLITENQELLGLVILLGVSVIASIFVHWIAICGRLYRHGARFPTGLLFWRVFRELRKYRDLTCGLGKPLTLYYFAFILAWFNLLLAFAIAIRMLWLQSHPGGY